MVGVFIWLNGLDYIFLSFGWVEVDFFFLIWLIIDFFFRFLKVSLMYEDWL